jgi:hypothetical protein
MRSLRRVHDFAQCGSSARVNRREQSVKTSGEIVATRIDARLTPAAVS